MRPDGETSFAKLISEKVWRGFLWREEQQSHIKLKQ